MPDGEQEDTPCDITGLTDNANQNHWPGSQDGNSTCHTNAHASVEDMLRDLQEGKKPGDDSLGTASDIALDQLHYKDFPALCRACAELTVKSKDKKLNVFF